MKILVLIKSEISLSTCLNTFLFVFLKTSEDGQSMVIVDISQWSWGYFRICRLCCKLSGGLFLKYCLQSRRFFSFSKIIQSTFAKGKRYLPISFLLPILHFFFFRHFISRRKCYLITVLSLCFLVVKSKSIFFFGFSLFSYYLIS